MNWINIIQEKLFLQLCVISIATQKSNVSLQRDISAYFCNEHHTYVGDTLLTLGSYKPMTYYFSNNDCNLICRFCYKYLFYLITHRISFKYNAILIQTKRIQYNIIYSNIDVYKLLLLLLLFFLFTSALSSSNNSNQLVIG